MPSWPHSAYCRPSTARQADRVTLVYDTGALLAAERNDRALWLLHRQALANGITPTVPLVVLAQAWRGGPQHSLSRLLSGCLTGKLDEPMCRAAGVLCARAGTSDIVDALVVITAKHLGAAIVTSDSGDVTRLAKAAEHSGPIRSI